jgi:pimeloyl-ACP methyl ester carboxylesterase
MVLEFHGHGTKPDVNQPWSIELFAHQLEEAIQALPSPLPIFGYSMGGYVALLLSLRKPELVPRLLTLGTKFSWGDYGITDDSARELDSKTVAMMRLLQEEPLLTLPIVDKVSIPVRYCVGDRDRMVTIEETMAFYRATPGAEFCVLPNTRHLIEKVDADLLADQVRRFLLV